MADTIKKIAILGSTGSIGQQALDVIRTFSDKFQVIALAGGRNVRLLEKQISEFRPEMFYSLIKPDVSYEGKLLSMEEIASHHQVDLVLIATSGKVGLYPTLAALRAGKRVALANKEVLVMAGEIIVREARQHRARILPIDSEHSAIWQCLRGERNNVHRLFLTASGGPFYHYSRTQLAEITVEQALQHPVWKMGKKVSIDSATLANKGLEVIEAHWLFHVPFENIEILIHPQCIVHSMVEFVDGSVKAQLSFPDMRLPIQYAICFPERLFNPGLPRRDLGKSQSLNFESVNENKFPCLKLALRAGKLGGTYPAVFCAADEVAVELFLSRQIGFPDIAPVVEQTLERHQCQGTGKATLDEILQADAWAREYARQVAHRHYEAYLERGEGTQQSKLRLAE